MWNIIDVVFLRKQLTLKFVNYFHEKEPSKRVDYFYKKSPSYMFRRALNTPLELIRGNNTRDIFKTHSKI